MKGKYKLLALTLISLFASLSVVSAKEMTVEEIGAAIAEAEPNASYAIVVGTHAFSSSHIITTAEFMAASTTIDTTGYNNIIDAMAINIISRSRDAQGNFSAWSVEAPILGDKLDAKTNIDYVDLKYEGVSVDTDDIISDAVTELNAAILKNSSLKNNLTVSYSDGTITVKEKSSVTLNKFDTLSELLVNEIKSGNYEFIKLTEILATDVSTTAETEIIDDEYDVASALTAFVTAKKSFTIEFKVIDGVVNTGKYNKYSVNFVSEYKVFDNVIKGLLTTKDNPTAGYELTCDGNTCKLNVLVASTNAVKNSTDFGKILSTKLSSALPSVSSKVKSIVVGSSEITKSEGIENIISVQLAAMGKTSVDALTLGDLISQSITIKINLIDNVVSENNNNTEVYTINVVAETNTNKLVEDNVKNINTTIESYSKNDQSQKESVKDSFKLSYENGIITMAVIKNDTVLKVGYETGLLSPVLSLVSSGLYESINLKYGSESIDLMSSGKDIFTFLEAMGISTPKTNGVKLDDLVNKTITVELKTKSGVKNAGLNKYTILFTGSVNTDNDLNSLIDKLGLGSAPEKVAKDNIIDLNSIDLKNNLDATEFATEMRKQANKYASIVVTFNNKDYTIAKNDGDEENITSYGDLKDLKAALEVEKTIFKGQLIKVQYNLLSDRVNTSENGEIYTIKYTVLRNTKSALNDAINTIKTTVTTAKTGSNALVPKLVTSDGNNYINDKNEIIFDVKLSTTTVENLKLGLTAELAKFFAQDWYESIAFIYNGTRIDITCDKSTSGTCVATSVKGVDKLIEALGGVDKQIGAVADDTRSLQIEFVLANGVTNQISNTENNDETKLIYDIILSKKVSAKETLGNSLTSEKVASGFVPKFDENDMINALYLKAADTTGNAYNFLKNASMYTELAKILSDVRFESIVLNIGNADSITLVTGKTTVATTEIDAALGMVFKNHSEGFDYKKATISEFVKELGSNKITLTLNLKNGRAVFEENGTTSITYELRFSEYDSIVSSVTGITTVEVNSSAQSDWKDGKLDITVNDTNKAQSVTVKLSSLESLFTKNISSIEINGVYVTADEYADAKANANGDTEKLLARLNNAINKILGITETKEAVTAEELIGKTITIKVNMVSGILSENAKTSEIITISFIQEK